MAPGCNVSVAVLERLAEADAFAAVWERTGGRRCGSHPRAWANRRLPLLALALHGRSRTAPERNQAYSPASA